MRSCGHAGVSDPELLDAIASGDLILWIGGAPSVAAGLPDTATQARELLDHAARLDSSIDVVSLTQWIETRPEDVLEQLQHSLGAEFQRGIERRLSDQGGAVPEVARAVAALRNRLKAIYTTRFDRVLERVLERAWPSFADARPGLAQRSG